MATGDSNTFVEPTAGTAINTARGQVNGSLRALLRNFYSSVTPTGPNIIASGTNQGEQDGMLFRMANANVAALYISDSANKKSSEVGGNFTRVGIGNRVENGIGALAANVTHYEIGELVATVSADGALASNARLYLSKGNTNSMTDFIDVGIPPTNGSVTAPMIGNLEYLRFSNALVGKTKFTTNADIKLGSAGSGDGNTAIGFNTNNVTSNVSLVKNIQESGHGLSIIDQDGDYGPLRSNIVFQSTVAGTDTAISELIPVGTMVVWGKATAPSGWLLCDGTAISRTTYSALFAQLGTVYGVGNGSSTFNLPNFRDRAPVGAGANMSLGDQVGALAASGVITTNSGTADLTLGTASFASSAKDSAVADAVISVTAGGHTHTLTLPHVAVNFIIKT